MSRAAQRRFHAGASDSHKALLSMFNAFGHRHVPYDVFSDFVEMSALAISNAVDRRHFDEREKRYLEIAKKYDRTELTRFADMLGALTQVFEDRVQQLVPGGDGLADILGMTFMMLDLGNGRTGQFFTPYSVSRVMAKMNVGDGRPYVDREGFITVLEPACGAGGMVIACADALHDAGHNYQQTMHATCIDIDPRCVHMCYLQMALLHIPGVVVHGNGLTGESWNHWFTPAHILGGWGRRLQKHRDAGLAGADSDDALDVGATMDAAAPSAQATEIVVPASRLVRMFVPDDQLALF